MMQAASFATATATATTTTTTTNWRPRSIYVLLLLISILSHGILLSSRSIQPALQSATTGFGYSSSITKSAITTTTQSLEDSLEEDTPADKANHNDSDGDGDNGEVRHENEQQQQQQQLRKRTPQEQPQEQPQQQQERQRQRQRQLPHWRLATDCSSYSLDCFVNARRDNKYLPYPFSSSLRDELELGSGNDNDNDNGNGNDNDNEHDDWSVEEIDRLDPDWIERLEQKTSNSDNAADADADADAMLAPIAERHYLYPTTVPDTEYQTCMDRAVHGNLTYSEQLDALLTGNGDAPVPVVVPEPDTNMVAFTISDYSYVHDMLHEVFQMMDDVAGFSRRNFFLVAIDEASADLACQHGYPVLLWKTDAGNLKNAVANTKVVLSHELVQRGVDFFFTEMDVWWIRSPKPQLVDFQSKHRSSSTSSTDKTNNNSNNNNSNNNDHAPHILFSGHQNNYNAPNIGVYAVKADEFSEEYFRVCLDVLRQKPKTHDQWVMAEVYRLFRYRADDRDYDLGGSFEPDGPPPTPTVEHPFEATFFSPHSVVADERPMPTHETLAIHTLNNAPLQMPHGKKMVARELGIYYGFRTRTRPKSGDGGGGAADAAAAAAAADAGEENDNAIDNNEHVAAGYYDRTGTDYRRYLWLDTDLRSNFYSMSHGSRYHDKNVLEWTMAILIAIARKTDRILVLPQVFNADMDAGSYFPWTMMDYSKLADSVDFRETNFPSNPKAWNHQNNNNNNHYDNNNNDDDDDDDDDTADASWPFETVVNTGLFAAKDPTRGDLGVSIYTQVSDRSSIVSQKAWKATLHNWDWLDAWIGALLSVPELDKAEVLLVNPDVFMDGGKLWGMVNRLIAKQRHDEDVANGNEQQQQQQQKQQQQQQKTQSPLPVGRMEAEVMEIHGLLGWCWDTGMQHTVSKVSASDSCYGIGTPKVYQ